MYFKVLFYNENRHNEYKKKDRFATENGNSVGGGRQ